MALTQNNNTDGFISPDRIRQDVAHLQDWLSKQPHLPPVESEEWLTTYHHHNKYNLERTKTKLDNYFSQRNKYPKILKNRDPLGEEIAQSRIAANVSMSNRITRNGERVFFGSVHPDASLFDYWALNKRNLMICDALCLEGDKHDSIIVVDTKNTNYGHFLKSLPGMKVSFDVYFSAYSERIKAIHMINCPVGMETFLNTIKGFLPTKMAGRFFIHASPEGLNDFIDESVVCSDFGGKGPTLAEYDEYTAQLLAKHRDWFLEQDNVSTNEALRRKPTSQPEELNGSFRKLEFD